MTTVNPVSAAPVARSDLESPAKTTAASASTSAADAGTTTATTTASKAVQTPEQSKADLNRAIIESSLEVSVKSGNEPLALLYRSAIQGINEALAPTQGENALENAASQDNTPEATAKRIVSQATGFYAAYQAQQARNGQSASLEDFMATIRKGFEQGFNEAKDILKGLQVLDTVGDGIQKTYDLVTQGFADFETTTREAEAKAKTASTGSDTGTSTGTSTGKPDNPAAAGTSAS